MSLNVLVYTFKTFPYIEELKAEFSDIHIFSKLKIDIKAFLKLVCACKPTHIIGIAKSHSLKSYFEPVTINRFNKSGEVVKQAGDTYDLYVPAQLEPPFQLSSGPSTSFCNYSMFKISHFLAQENIKTRFSFIHIGQSGIGQLKNALSL